MTNDSRPFSAIKKKKKKKIVTDKSITYGPFERDTNHCLVFGECYTSCMGKLRPLPEAP
jgi:hypothetical protein